MRNIFLFAALMVAAKSIPNTTNYTDTSCTNSNECNAGFNCENKDHYGGGGQCEPVCANDLDCDVRYMNSYYKCDSVNNMCVYRECNNQTDCTNMYGQDYICDTTVDWYYQCTYNGPAMCYNTTECNSGENCEGKDHYGGGGKCQPECNNDLDCDARYMNSNYKCDANMGNMCVYKECNNDNDCGMIDYKCDKSVDWYYQCFYDPTYCTNSSQCTAPQNCEGLNMNGNSGTCQQPCLNDTTCAQRYNYYYKCDVTMGNMCVYRECYNDTYCTNMYDQYHACNTTVDWYYFCQYNGPTMCYNVTECNSGENCEGKDHYGSNGKCQPECNNDQDCRDRYNNDANYKCDVSMGNMCVYKECDNDIDCTNYGIDYKCDTSVNWYYQCSYSPTYCTNSSECVAPQNCERDGHSPSGTCQEPCIDDTTCDQKYGMGMGMGYHKCDTVSNMCVYRECNNQTDCGQDYICDTTVDWYYQCTYNGPAMCYNSTECNGGENCEGKDHYGGNGKCQPECNNEQECRGRYYNNSYYKCDVSMGNMCVYKECDNDIDCTNNYGIDYKCDKSVDWYYQCFHNPTYCTNSNECVAPQNCEGLDHYGSPSSGTCQEPCIDDTTCNQRYGMGMGYYKCDSVNNMCVYRECNNQTDCTNMYGQYYICDTTVDWYYQCQYNGPTMCYNSTECNGGENCEGRDHYGSNGKCQPECNNDQDCYYRYHNMSTYKCDVSMGNMCVYKECDNDIDCGMTNYKCDKSVDWYYQCIYEPTYCTNSNECTGLQNCENLDHYGSPASNGTCQEPCSNDTTCDQRYSMGMGMGDYKCDTVNNNMCVYRECYNNNDCINMRGQYYICDTSVDWYYQCQYNGPTMCYNVTECNSGENCEGRDHYGSNGKCQPECNNDQDCSDRYNNDANYKCDANMGNMCVYRGCLQPGDCTNNNGDDYVYTCDTSVPYYYMCQEAYCNYNNITDCDATSYCDGMYCRLKCTEFNEPNGHCELNMGYDGYFCDISTGQCSEKNCINYFDHCSNYNGPYSQCNTTTGYCFEQYCNNSVDCTTPGFPLCDYYCYASCVGKDTSYCSNYNENQFCNNDNGKCEYLRCNVTADCTAHASGYVCADWGECIPDCNVRNASYCQNYQGETYTCQPSGSCEPTYCNSTDDCVLVNANWVCDTNYGSPYGFAGECMVGCNNNTFCERNHGYHWLCNVNGLCEEFIPSCTNDTFCQNFYQDSYRTCDLTTNECIYTDWCTDDEFCTNMYDNMHICIIDTGECKYVDSNMTTTTENPTNTKDMTTTKDMTNTADMTTSTGMATATSKGGSTTEAMTTNVTKEMSTTEEIVDVCVDDVKKNRCHGNAGECDKDKRHGYSKYNQIKQVDVDEWCVWCLCEDYWRCAYYALPAITQLVDDNDMWESVKGDFAQDAKNWFMETCFGHLGASECSFAQVELKDPVTGCKCDTFTCNGYDGKTETVDTDNNSDGGKSGVFGTMVVAFGMVLWI